ncbi:MAG: hypothetical protein GY714_07700 [Desulfobacterales bacterium]|nr:hypothetical protein [Desulfobacterales bacterium]MCP4161408.1 hypothetical protein [Deltaproteobacteria bacterium]
MPDDKIISICKFLIEKNSGSISGLKHELKNTVVNVYYKEIENFILQNELDASEISETEIMDKLSSDKISVLTRMINSLKEIIKKEGKKEIGFITQLVLDEMKFGINDAHKLSEVSRFIKRFFRKKSVDEIENLVAVFGV